MHNLKHCARRCRRRLQRHCPSFASIVALVVVVVFVVGFCPKSVTSGRISCLLSRPCKVHNARKATAILRCFFYFAHFLHSVCLHIYCFTLDAFISQTKATSLLPLLTNMQCGKLLLFTACLSIWHIALASLPTSPPPPPPVPLPPSLPVH